MRNATRQTWKQRPKKKRRERAARDLRRAAIVGFIGGLVALLAFFLFAPFFTPRTHLVLIGSDPTTSFGITPLRYDDRDLSAFETLDGVTVHRTEGWLRSPESVQGLAERVEELGVAGPDTLVVYLAAHGISVDGKPYLLARPFDSRRPDTERISIETLLQQISKSPAKNKVLLLNAGSIDYDPRLGMLVNEFPRLLRRAVDRLGDPKLWVLCSHSELEHSHVSPAAGRSVFGMFLDHALRGAADLDGDQVVSLHELAAFSTANVSPWVEHQTDRRASQRPQLLWAGTAPEPTSNPHLVRLDDQREATKLTVAAVLNQSSTDTANGLTAGGAATASGTQGVLRRHQVRLVSTSPETSQSQSPSKGDDADGGVSDDAKAAAGNEMSRAMAWLQRAWTDRDQLAQQWSPARRAASPIENVPHLWREFQTELLDLEQQVRTGKPIEPQRMQALLPGATSAGEKQDAPSGHVLAGLFDTGDASAARLFADRRPHSFALAKLLSLVPQQQVDSLDLADLQTAIAASTRKPLDAWLKKHLNETVSRYFEFDQLGYWADRSDLDWTTTRSAAAACFAGERAAAIDAISPGWVRGHVDVGDQLQFSAGSLLRASATASMQTRATDLFQGAIEAYAKAEQTFDVVRQAQRLRDELFCELPALLRYRRSGITLRQTNLEPGDVAKLIEHLGRLIDELHDASSTNTDSLRERIRVLNAAREKSRRGLDDQAVEALANRPPLPGDGWIAERMLQSPLISAAGRRTLNSLTRTIDRDVALQFQLPIVRSSHSSGETPSLGTAKQRGLLWQALLIQAELEDRFIRLGSCSDQKNACLHAVDDAMSQLQQAHQNWMTSVGRAKEDSESLRQAEEKLWKAHAQFGDRVGSFYRNLAAVPDPGDNGIHDGESLVQVLRIMDARDAWRFRKLDVTRLTSPARLRSTLGWQSSRLQQMAIYQAAASPSAIDESIDHYRRAEASLPAATKAPKNRSRLMIEHSDSLDLQYRHSQSTEVWIENPTDRDVDVTILIDFSEDALSVDIRGDATFEKCFRRDTSGLAQRRSGRIALTAGQRARFTLSIQRTGKVISTAWLAINAIEIDDDESSVQLLGRPSLARHTVPVAMPVAELVVIDGLRRFQSDVDGLTLHPFANRTGDIQLGISGAKSGRTVSVRCYALRPEDDRASDESLDQRYGSSEPAIAFQATDPVEGASVTLPTATPPAAAATKAPVDIKTNSKQPIDISAGLLAVIEDTAGGRKTYRRIRFAVQRPSRFLQPTVHYDASLRRVGIRVAAIDASLLPGGPPVQVRCGLGTPFSGTEKGRLQTTLSRSQPEASLFIRLPLPLPDVVRVHVDVDDFPRAFQYDIETGTSATLVPEVRGRVEARLQTQSGGGYLAATKTVPINVQIDSPPGFFDFGKDFVELGPDLDRDGLPDPASSMRLLTDRDVQIDMNAKANGKLTWFARVSDFDVSSPVGGIENVPLQIAGRLVVGQRSQPVRGIPILIDTLPPEVGPINGTNAVEPKKPMHLSIWATDDGSGVKLIEAVFDATGSGAFPEKAKPVAAKRTSQGEWKLTLPAPKDPGEHVLLVRGGDRVGNVCEPIPYRFSVLGGSETSGPPPIALRGFVSFADQLYAGADVSVQVVPAAKTGKKKPPATAKTKASGTFIVDGLKPGTYTVTARAVIQNRVRMAKTEVTLAPDQPAPELTLALK